MEGVDSDSYQYPYGNLENVIFQAGSGNTILSLDLSKGRCGDKTYLISDKFIIYFSHPVILDRGPIASPEGGSQFSVVFFHKHFLFLQFSI